MCNQDWTYTWCRAGNHGTEFPSTNIIYPCENADAVGYYCHQIVDNNVAEDGAVYVDACDQCLHIQWLQPLQEEYEMMIKQRKDKKQPMGYEYHRGLAAIKDEIKLTGKLRTAHIDGNAERAQRLGIELVQSQERRDEAHRIRSARENEEQARQQQRTNREAIADARREGNHAHAEHLLHTTNPMAAARAALQQLEREQRIQEADLDKAQHAARREREKAERYAARDAQKQAERAEKDRAKQADRAAKIESQRAVFAERQRIAWAESEEAEGAEPKDKKKNKKKSKK